MKRTEIYRLFPGIDPETISLLPVLDRFHEGVIITDRHGVILYMNGTQLRIDDLRIDDAIGRTVTELYRVDEGTSPTMACLKTGRPIENLACYYRTRLGKVVNSIHNIYPLRSDGRLIGAICCITDYKNIEQTLAAISQTGSPRSVSTFGVSPVTVRVKPGGNGTRYRFGDIIGAHADLLAAVKTAQLTSDSPSPIMLFGETGTGKEMFAQSIHNRSARKSRPYVAINCAAIPENLLEGLLCGTSKGAFTGAIDKAGLFETADGGTLFLDEINAMSPGLQAKLLRFLQERKVRRVGALQEIDVDLKVISSVNVLPHAAIESGSMRADLFYRLAVVFIKIPPLR
ncbi:MAG: sigma 54-interacting transcriptional regulator, partial [Desulfobacteraceae bacterium]|nr:sigma 54-interacting transcriptional regulator [Desulfobacteraceae bacterium]